MSTCDARFPFSALHGHFADAHGEATKTFEIKTEDCTKRMHWIFKGWDKSKDIGLIKGEKLLMYDGQDFLVSVKAHVKKGHWYLAAWVMILGNCYEAVR